MERKSIIIRDAAELAVLGLPLYSLAELGLPLPGQLTEAWLFLLSLAGGLLSFCALLSGSTKTALKKWALSIPFTAAFCLFLAHTDFQLRLLNTVLPGYGRLSGGGGFSSFLYLVIFLGVQGLANLLAASFSAEAAAGWVRKPLAVMRAAVVPAICAAILLAVLYLELTMPSWEAIYYSVYG